MKPKSRLLIRLTLPNGDMKSWGYDHPYFTTPQQLHDAIQTDFETIPENTEIHLSYMTHETVIEATETMELADTAIDWLQGTCDYN